MVSRLLTGAVRAFLPARDPALLPEARLAGVWQTPAVDAVLAWASRLAGEPDQPLPRKAFLRFFEDGDRQEYEEHYFGRRRRLEVFALAVLSGRGHEFAAPLSAVIEAVCGEATWALPAHLKHPDDETVDLFAAETASALAEIACLAGESLPASLRARVEAEIERRVLGPYTAEREPWPWEAAPHNWAAVCGGGVGVAALWLLPPERLGPVLSRLGPTFDAYLAGFSDDGICLEGMGYWTYGMGYFTAFAELLRVRSGGALDLLGHPSLAERLRTIAAFPASGRLGTRSFARFSDSPEQYLYSPGLVSRLSERLGLALPLDPASAETLKDDPCSRWVRHLRDYLWTAPSPRTTLPKETRWYPSAQWLVARGEADLAAKGGHNGEPHNHNDLGSFQLVADDDEFLDDLGAGRYERDYFGEGRYGYFVNSSRSHSVPLIDGREQQLGAQRRAVASFEAPRRTLSLGLEAAYDAGGLVSLQRRLHWGADVLPLTVTDWFRFDSPGHEVVERFVTRLPVVLVPQGAEIRGRRTLRITAEAPKVSVTPVAYAPHEGPDQTAYCIDFAFKVDQEAELSFVFDLIS